MINHCNQVSREELLTIAFRAADLGLLEVGIDNRICTMLRVALYKNFLDEILTEMNEYMKHNEPPNAWGVGYFANIPGFGRNFYDKWTQAIAQSNPDEEFRRILLYKIPGKWQATFKPRNFCEYKWEEMPDREIAKALSGLTRKESFKQNWGLGSVESWVDEQGRKTGMSFYNAWITKIAPGDPVEEFKRKILLHIEPSELRDSFEHIEPTPCPHNWDDMVNGNIATTLIGLVKPTDPEETVWTFSSIHEWTGNSGELWGKSFYNYWCHKHDNPTMELRQAMGIRRRIIAERAFINEILPHLSVNCRRNFQGRHDRA